MCLLACFWLYVCGGVGNSFADRIEVVQELQGATIGMAGGVE